MSMQVNIYRGFERAWRKQRSRNRLTRYQVTDITQQTTARIWDSMYLFYYRDMTLFPCLKVYNVLITILIPK